MSLDISCARHCRISLETCICIGFQSLHSSRVAFTQIHLTANLILTQANRLDTHNEERATLQTMLSRLLADSKTSLFFMKELVVSWIGFVGVFAR